MKHIPQADAEVFQNGDVASWEYETTSTAMNVARIKVNGRYPESGFVRNQEVDSIVHVIGGEGILGIQNGARIELAPHDRVHLAVNDTYFFEGELELLYAATPKWTPEQAEYID